MNDFFSVPYKDLPINTFLYVIPFLALLFYILTKNIQNVQTRTHSHFIQHNHPYYATIITRKPLLFFTLNQHPYHFHPKTIQHTFLQNAHITFYSQSQPSKRFVFCDILYICHFKNNKFYFLYSSAYTNKRFNTSSHFQNHHISFRCFI